MPHIEPLKPSAKQDKVKRLGARGIRDKKLPATGRSPYDNPPTKVRDPNRRYR